jgi:hypothetical protein
LLIDGKSIREKNILSKRKIGPKARGQRGSFEKKGVCRSGLYPGPSHIWKQPNKITR